MKPIIAASTLCPTNADTAAAITKTMIKGFANPCHTSARMECRLVAAGSFSPKSLRDACARSVVKPAMAGAVAVELDDIAVCPIRRASRHFETWAATGRVVVPRFFRERRSWMLIPAPSLAGGSKLLAQRLPGLWQLICPFLGLRAFILLSDLGYVGVESFLRLAMSCRGLFSQSLDLRVGLALELL